MKYDNRKRVRWGSSMLTPLVFCVPHKTKCWLSIIIVAAAPPPPIHPRTWRTGNAIFMARYYSYPQSLGELTYSLAPVIMCAVKLQKQTRSRVEYITKNRDSDRQRIKKEGRNGKDWLFMN